MRRKNERRTDDADRIVKDIRRQTRKRYSSEDKIRIVLAGLRGDDSIAELCRQEGIAQSLPSPMFVVAVSLLIRCMILRHHLGPKYRRLTKAGPNLLSSSAMRRLSHAL